MGFLQSSKRQQQVSVRGQRGQSVKWGRALGRVGRAVAPVVEQLEERMMLAAASQNVGIPIDGVWLGGVSLTNLPPTAVSANGPYSINPGGMLALSAAASDPEGDALSYSWDINGDGTFGDATGKTPGVSWAQLEALGITGPMATSNVRVRVSDGQGNIVSSPATSLTVKPLFVSDARSDYTAGSYPMSVTAADFNGDGKADLAVANYASNSVSVLLNSGNGNFSFGGDYATGSHPVSVTAADFNGDGETDLAAANAYNNSVSVLLNSGSGTFSPRSDYDTGSYPVSVTAADFNGDGKTDLAVANQDSDSVSVLLNSGSGTFSPRSDYATGSSPASVTAGDFSGDGKADLAVANEGSNSVSVLLSNGNGGFGSRSNYATASRPYSVAAADFNGDGKADLAVANYASNSVSVLLNNGNGSLGSRSDYAAGSQPYSVAAADFSGDGKADLAVANVGSNSVSVLLNGGNGGFNPKVDYASGIDPLSVSAADFNGDGRMDLAAANISSNTVTVLLNRGNGSFNPRRDYATGSYPSAVTAADFNGDGKADLAVANSGSGINGSSCTISVLLNSGDGSLSPRSDYDTGSYPRSLTAADFNGDGRMDLAAANYPGGQSVSVLLNRGDGSFSPRSDYATSSTSRSVTAADFNGNGRMDLALANYPGSSVSVLLNRGDGSFSPRSDYATGDSPSAVTAADFNGDGKADLTVASGSSVSVLLNRGDGSFSPRSDYATGGSPYSIACADFNGDGKADLAMTNIGSNSVSVLLNSGDGSFSLRSDYATGRRPIAVTTADFNGDGKADLAVANEGGDSVSVLLNSGNGSFSPKSDCATGDSPSAVTAADFNGDGRMDLAVANYASSSVSVLLNGGNGAPTGVSAGGPYTLNEGSTLTLDASGSSDPEGDPLAYSWDINGDGVFGDAIGVSPTLTWNQLKALGTSDGPRTISGVRVRVDDGHGNVVDSPATTLTISNVAPALALSGAASVGQGNTYTLALSSSDPGDDTITSWIINWGDGNVEPISGNPTSVTHVYSTVGSKTISATATDEDGTYAAGNTLVVSVTLVAPPAPANVQASDGTFVDKVQVTWSAAEDAAAYDVYRSVTGDPAEAVKISGGDVVGNSFDDTSAVRGGRYYYWVKAKNAAGTSAFSAADVGELGHRPPTGVALSNSTVAENRPAGTVVGSFSTTDPDTQTPGGDSFSYELVPGVGDTDNGLFVIDGAVLKTTASLNYESRRIYSICVRVTDAGGNSFTRTLVVAASDVNEAPTVSQITKTIARGSVPFSAADFTGAFHDVDGGDSLHSIRLVTGPARGALTLNGQAVHAGDEIALAHLGGLSYIMPLGGIPSSDSLSYIASDGELWASTPALVHLVVQEGPQIATLTDGHLVINGTDAADTITMQSAEGVLSVTLAGVGTQNFNLADVSDISIIGGPGGDTITVQASPQGPLVTIAGGGGNDTLIGGMAGELLKGGKGNDVIYGKRGNDAVRGGPGDDDLRGNGGADHVYGGAGRDTVRGNGGNDTLTGGGLGDVLLGGGGDDWLLGRDMLADALTGGAGHDRAQVDRGLDQVSGVEELLA